MHPASAKSLILTSSLLIGCLAAPQVRAQSAPDPAAALAENLPAAPLPQLDRESSSALQNPAPAAQTPPAQQQNAPQNPAAPDLSDLGFSTAQTKADPKMQAMLDRRTHMLKVHQTLGLYTLIPMAATLVTGPMAKAKGKNGQPIKEPTAANLDFHVALGGLTGAMYVGTAYYAMFAPRVSGVKHKGPIRLHEALTFIHGPGMIATSVLGAMAYKQENAGEKVHGIASAHGPVAVVTISAYAAAMLAVSWPPKFLHHDH